MSPTHHRRDFLKMSLGTSALAWLPLTAPGRLYGAVPSQTPANDRVLVVVQLTGGNDGLNCVVPYEDDQYYKQRPTISLPAGELHKFEPHFGFHPRMSALRRLYDQGLLSVVQGVGYPNPDGDHDASMRNWQTGRPHQPSCQTGWLGRAVDHIHQPGTSDVPAVFVGAIRQPFTFNAETEVVPSIRSIDQWLLGSAAGGNETRDPDSGISAGLDPALTGRDDHRLLDFVRRSTQAAYETSEKVQRVLQAQSAASARGYPPFEFARTLHTVAQLIRADVGVRMFGTELGGDGFGGFDNHANQRGNHGALLHQLSESIGAFVHDLQRDHLAERVLLMTYSEFGRTIAENGRRGTDHGSAAPVFLAGGRLKGGLIGRHPSLTEPERGGLKFHTDFRRVYATALGRWLGIDRRAILDETFQPLDVLQA